MNKVKAIVQVGKLGKLEEASVKPSDTAVEVVPKNAYGLSKVTVDAIKLQEKTVKSSETPQTVVADEEYNGLSAVNVVEAKLQAKAVEPAEETLVVTADNGNYGLESVTVKAIKLQDKSVTANNTVQTVTADEEYTALKSVKVDAVKLQDKEVTLTADKQVIKADNGFVGLNSVTVPGAGASAINFGKFAMADKGVYVYADNSEWDVMQMYRNGEHDDNKRVLDVPNYRRHIYIGASAGSQDLEDNYANIVKLRCGFFPTRTNQDYSWYYNSILEEWVFHAVKGVVDGLPLSYYSSDSNDAFNHLKNLKIIVIEQDSNDYLVTLSDATAIINNIYHYASGGDGVIYVADELLEQYKAATNWSAISEFLHPMGEYKGWSREID